MWQALETKDPRNAPALYLDGATKRTTILSRDHHGPRAILNGLERLAGNYDSQRTTSKQDLEIAEAQIRDP